MRVMLIGKSGMLGSVFLKMLAGSEDFEMFAFGREEMDLNNKKVVDELFERISPDFVINCAAYTNVDGAEEAEGEAFAVNAEAVRALARVCKREKAVLVHFSTDYVFDGKREDGYAEDDATAPLGVYGKSKLAGEVAIAEEMEEYYIVRTAWLYGEDGANFVDTMLRLGQEVLEGKREGLSVVSDQVGSPTYTHDLYRVVMGRFLSPFLGNVERHHEHSLGHDGGGSKLPFGIYHVTNSGKCSWFEFAKEIFKQRGMEVLVSETTAAEFGRPAPRPGNSILISTKADFGVRSWQEGLRAYLG